MPYIIDGHNLIPKIPGLRLDDPEDEKKLIELLGEFCSQTGKEAEIYFDKAPPGQARAKSFGRVTARFVRDSETADQAIMRHLKRLDKRAANWTVVSSDHQVQNAARRARARVIPAAEFAQMMLDEAPSSKEAEPNLSESDIDEWLDLFQGGDPEDE